jgi:Tfp pilus assembly protein PilF
MRARVVNFLAMTLAFLAVLPCGADEGTNALYRKGVQLIQPYLVLTDAPAADPSTPKGRTDLLEGIDLLNKVITEEPENWAAQWIVGKAHQALRNHRAAYESFRRAYATKSDNPDVGRELVIEAICVGSTKEAVATAQQLSIAHPENAGLAANTGLALLANGNLKEARESTELAIKLAPDDAITKNLLAEIAAAQAGRGQTSYCPR